MVESFLSFNAACLVAALAIDAVLSWPAGLYARIGHPVTWIGAVIAALEARFNRSDKPATWRRAAGLGCALFVITAAAGAGGIAQIALPGGWPGVAIGAVLAWPMLAARSLYDHAAAVAEPLARNDIALARIEIAKIVGRDPATLDAPAIARAALESLSENTSDGVIAPLFWGLLLGLPGLYAYKAINTLDSMIGHRNARYEQFGWAAARIDDGANLAPARLTGLLYCLSAFSREAVRIMLRDARKHRSPNAGWPESAMAGAIGVRLSGPRLYGGASAAEPWLNAGARDPESADMNKGLALFRRVVAAAGALLLAVGALA